MNLASSTKHVLLALGIGVTFTAACGGTDSNTPDMTATTYTWKQVSTDMKNSCAIATSCHQSPTSPSQAFNYDKTLTPGSDMANYTALMTAMLINTATPASSTLLVVGQGGTYTGAGHPHSGTNLSTTQAANWTSWITAGATFQ
jgi:hypothetical protein